jgi:hypothetical protein
MNHRLRHPGRHAGVQFGSLYLQGDELKKTSGTLDGLEARRGPDLAQL